MRWFAQFLLVGAAGATLQLRNLRPSLPQSSGLEDREQPVKVPRQDPAGAAPKFLTPQTRKFAVNGTGLPNVDFDVGESYAGNLPISSNANDTNQLFFWFFPSENKTVDKEITIWLTGGPGCSSVGELMTENGPFLWQTGVFKPFKNKWSWHRLTNIVYIDQPIGTGFSTGTVTAKNEFDVAKQFLGFWKNFVETFALQGYKIYITGSSYSGMYCPYIASAMLDTNDTQNYNVKGMQIWDGVFSDNPVAEDIPASKFAKKWQNVLGLNDSSMASISNASATCGYDNYLQKYLTFPPKERQPSALPGQQPNKSKFIDGCDTWNAVFDAANEVNPCFSIYTITELCPFKYDPLGFLDGTNYVPEGSGPVYLNRPDVKAAIHAPPNTEWKFCTDQNVFVNGTDTSLVDGPGSQPVLPSVIDRTKNVIIGHGSKDFVLIADGTLLTIQNMSFGGAMGFQSRPVEPLFVPYHTNDAFTTAAGAGIQGTAHTERGLTYLAVGATGHFLTANAPALAFRSMEVLLGRVAGFQSLSPFTIDGNNTVQPTAALDNGTIIIMDGGVGSGILGGGNGAQGSGSGALGSGSGAQGGGNGTLGGGSCAAGSGSGAQTNQAEKRSQRGNVLVAGLVLLLGVTTFW